MRRCSGELKMRVFISYRRNDTKDMAGRLADRLLLDPAVREAFFDIESLPGGADFKVKIVEAVERANVVLILIGSDWVGARTDGASRMHDPNDFVRLETASALRSKARVIPVLINGATFPRKEELPEDVARLPSLSAFSIRHETFTRDTDALLDNLLGRKVSGFWAKYWRRHPAQLGLLRAILGFLGTATFVLLGAGLNLRLTGRSLDQVLGGVGPMVLAVSLVLLIGTLAPVVLARQRR